MWLILAAGAVGLAALPALRERGRRPILLRQAHPEGRLVQLTQGLTHIRQAGPAEGPVLVMVHGLTTPSFVFDGLIPELVARGHRVISYDHYGRGLSDRPRIPQTREVFVTHLTEVLAACEVSGPVALAGYSMGAAVVTAFAAAHPDRVTRLVLIAPAGLHAPLQGLSGALLQVPGLGAWLFLTTYPRRLRRGIEAERHLPGSVPGIADRQIDETRYRGFFPAILRSLRGILAAPLHAEHVRIARAGVPVTAVFGRDDALIPPQAAETLRALNPAAEIVVLDGAGHGLPYTHAPELRVAF